MYAAVLPGRRAGRVIRVRLVIEKAIAKAFADLRDRLTHLAKRTSEAQAEPSRRGPRISGR